MTSELTTAVRSALAGVIDPELRRPITELGMVKDITFDDAHNVEIGIYLTTSGCPKKAEIAERVTQAAADVDGVGTVRVQLDVMNDEQRTELRKQLRVTAPSRLSHSPSPAPSPASTLWPPVRAASESPASQ